ncbi:MAG TPA: type II secretion system F family protein [Candidatus Angelobacter sp.]|nr:type II secretion system F family protein [Candidatus Angelobacter sp.]
MLIFLISAAVTIFLLIVAVLVMLTGKDPVEARLMEVSAYTAPDAGTLIAATPSTGLARVAAQITSLFKPFRGLVSGFDNDLAYKLTLAGFRKPEHVEIFTAAKLLLPVVGIVAGTFFADNLITAVLVGAVGGFFLPDLVLSYLVTRRQTSIRLALPDALDLLVICMEAGLGIDQAMVRVGEEMAITAPSLAEEFQIVNREQRAGKPRLDAWRSMAERLDIEFIRQFVTMLVQTERFGTPIAHALGVFADTLRSRRMQAAEEVAAKTGVKLLFPLVLFIFPSIFVVSLGPAIINLQKMFQDLAK